MNTTVSTINTPTTITFASDEKLVAANGLTLCYETFGDPANPPLLLIMGLAMQMIAWPQGFCEQLAAAGYYVIRFDNRDIGRSTVLRDAGLPALPQMAKRLLIGTPFQSAYSLKDMAQDSVALLDALGIARAHVVGVSMGGMIAQVMAIHYPERLLSLTSIMSTTGERDLPHPRLTGLQMLFGKAPTGIDAYVDFSLRTMRLLEGSRYHNNMDELREVAQRAFQRGRTASGVARQFAAILAADGRRQALHNVTLPALVIHGTDDPLVPLPGGEDTARALPNGRLMVLQGLGHVMPRPAWELMLPEILALAGSAMPH